MDLVDTHCHLQFEEYVEVQAVITAAIKAGVNRMICVGTTIEDSRQAIELANRYPKNIWSAIGVHPHEADKVAGEKHLAAQLKELIDYPKTIAVGEVGLDLYKNYSDRDTQVRLLRRILDATADSGLPYVFHVRDAWADFWPVFDSYPNLRGVVHSFSSGTKQLEQVLKRGLYIGLNGIMTFTRDQAQLEAAKVVPRDRLLLETDAPFLTPAPERNQLCEPKHVAVTANFLANLREERIGELIAYTTVNAERLFGI